MTNKWRVKIDRVVVTAAQATEFEGRIIGYPADRPVPLLGFTDYWLVPFDELDEERPSPIDSLKIEGLTDEESDAFDEAINE